MRLTGYDGILTWLDAVSMVRAAFEGDGALFPSTVGSVSGVHSMADDTDSGDRKDGSRDNPSPDEAALSARLGSLDHRLSDNSGQPQNQD